MEGGETFIPKAPTMKVSDLFDVVVPHAKRSVMGIRPGEKLHEMLLTPEESRHSIELDDYYVIIPENASLDTQLKLEKFTKHGSRLEAGFHFSSNNAEKAMSKDELLRIVEKMEKLING
jgi:UDP-N-acetylglucosamine 4,6-dehydratase